MELKNIFNSYPNRETNQFFSKNIDSELENYLSDKNQERSKA